jgi:hypothetical protein
MLTSRARRRTALLAVPLAAALTVVSAPALAPAAHADSVAWAKQLFRDFRAAQQITKGKGVTIAILADGVDGRVATLRGAVLRGADFVRTPRPKKIDGTLLASLIAGGGLTRGSAFGIRGLAPGVKILPVRVVPGKDEPGARSWLYRRSSAGTMAKGIRYAADHGAGVIVATTYFWGDDTSGILAAVAYAQSKKAVVVSANPEAFSLPATATGAIGVAALTENGKRYRKFSAKNSTSDVAAPGFKLPSIGPGNSLWTFWGGVPAAAWVAATAALVRSEYPKLTPVQVEQVITRSARHPKGGYNTEVGFGVVNPIGALRQARAVTKQPPATVATQGVVADRAHFGGPAPEDIRAVRHDGRLVAGFSGLAGAGVLILLLVLVLAVRGRRRTAAPVGVPPVSPWPPAPGAMGPPPQPSTSGGSVEWPVGPPPESGHAPGPAPEQASGPAPESG